MNESLVHQKLRTLRSSHDSTIVAKISRITRTGIYGWAYDKAELSQRLNCRIAVNGSPAGNVVVANRKRTHLERTAVGDGCYGFSKTLKSPLAVKDIITLHVDGIEAPLVVRPVTEDDLRGRDAETDERHKSSNEFLNGSTIVDDAGSADRGRQNIAGLLLADEPGDIFTAPWPHDVTTANYSTKAGTAANSKQNREWWAEGGAPVAKRTLFLANSGQVKKAIDCLQKADVDARHRMAIDNVVAHLRRVLLDETKDRPLITETISGTLPRESKTLLSAAALLGAYDALGRGDASEAARQYKVVVDAAYQGASVRALSHLIGGLSAEDTDPAWGWLISRWRALFFNPTTVSEASLLARFTPADPDARNFAATLITACVASSLPLRQKVAIVSDAIEHGVMTADEIFSAYASLGEQYQALLVLSELNPQPMGGEAGYLAICRLLVDRERFDQADQWARKALEVFGSSFEIVNIAADAARLAGHFDRAIEFYRRSAELRPNVSGLINRIISCEAAAVARDPLRSAMRLELYRKQALADALSLLSKRAGDVVARFDYAKTLVQSENHEAAEEILSHLASSAPTVEILRLLQKVYTRLGRDSDVAAVGARLLQLDPENASVRVATAKAVRACGDLNAARQLLQEAPHRTIAIDRELVRTEFFAANFQACVELATECLKRHPSDVDLHILAAAASLELGADGKAASHLESAEAGGAAAAFPLDFPLFRYASLKKQGKLQAALGALNDLYTHIGFRGLQFHSSPDSFPLFDQLAPAAGTSLSVTRAIPKAGPSVSVIMTTYNAERYLSTSVRSVLKQSYGNLELIIVDDASSDSTPEQLMQIESIDPRVKVILKTTNDGTYVSKNLGIIASSGDIIAFQDSDDWSHPDRIAASVKLLTCRPELKALTTDWLRMTSDADLIIKAGGQVTHLCCISLVMWRSVLETVGFFDSVRVAADLELIQRLTRCFGRESIARVRWPLLLGRARPDSLTASEEFGMLRYGFTEPRRLYHEAATTHQMSTSDLYYPFPMRGRPFSAPVSILP